METGPRRPQGVAVIAFCPRENECQLNRLHGTMVLPWLCSQ
ncbi:hypothetical protein RTCIAT899_PC05105 (plasmid) [Rhizobium tropici CIAT 899]|nr:hypothetical protein RTCIAT899_PC05105 [Rhizobium tropici CIAT 899]